MQTLRYYETLKQNYILLLCFKQPQNGLQQITLKIFNSNTMYYDSFPYCYATFKVEMMSKRSLRLGIILKSKN